MPSEKRSKAILYVEIPHALRDELGAFAQARGSTLTEEVEHALRRHLRFPPPMPEPEPYVEPPPKRPRGRPRKDTENNSEKMP